MTKRRGSIIARWSLNPDSAEALANLAAVHQMQGDMDRAIESHARDRSRSGRTMGLFRHGGGIHFQHRVNEALAADAEALRIKPDYAEAYYNRSFVYLSGGDFARLARLRVAVSVQGLQGAPLGGPRWDGSPLEGRTLLVHAEQGLGDTLQFIRFVKSAAAARRPGLCRSAAGAGAAAQIVGLHGRDSGGAPLPKHDVQIALMSLPGVLGTTLETVPASVPYLAADPKLLKSWRNQLLATGAFNVGIAWQGNAAYMFDRFRSIPLAEFAPLADVAGVRLISLQKGPGVEQIAPLAGRFTVVDLGSTLDASGGAFMDTAAVMCNLDLVITSDTAAAHLAGAGREGVDGGRRGAGVALDAGPLGQPLVSDDAAVSATGRRGLGERVQGDENRIGPGAWSVARRGASSLLKASIALRDRKDAIPK